MIQGHLAFLGKHLNHSILLFWSVYRFYVYFHVRITLRHVDISLAYTDGFRKVKNSYIKSAYYSISDDYGANADETSMDGY